MKKIILTLAVLLLAAGCNKNAAPNPQNQNDANSSQTSQQLDLNKLSWTDYGNQTFSYKVSMPNSWKQFGTDQYVNFSASGRTDIIPADIAFNAVCNYSVGQGSAQTSSEHAQVNFGPNTFTEYKYFVTENGQKNLVNHIFTITYPAKYQTTHSYEGDKNYFKTACKNMTIIFSPSLPVSFESPILSSFRFSK